MGVVVVVVVGVVVGGGVVVVVVVEAGTGVVVEITSGFCWTRGSCVVVVSTGVAGLVFDPA